MGKDDGTSTKYSKKTKKQRKLNHKSKPNVEMANTVAIKRMVIVNLDMNQEKT